MLTRIFALHSLHSFKYPIGSSFLKPFILKNIFHFQSTFKMSTTVEVLRVKKLSEHATIPSRASEKAAGYDLVSAYDYTIPAHGKELIKTDIAVAIPDGYYGRVAPRSSLAWKSFIDVGAGVIDADYRGNVGVILFNHSSNDFVGINIQNSSQNFKVKKGDRVAQLIIEKIATPSVEEVDNLDDTVRGEGGYGSTGSNIADLKTKRAREN